MDSFSAQKEAIGKYFHEVLDQGKLELIEELFHPQCVMHRTGAEVTGINGVRGVAERRKENFSRFESQIHDIFGSGDRVVARITHRGVGRGLWRSRLGDFTVTDREISWTAIAIFRFEKDKIIEEWVRRDDLGILLQFGILTPSGDLK